MLYKNNGGANWWMMFRDPKRPGKYIRKSTGTSNQTIARQIERATYLSIKGQLEEKQLSGILDSIFGKHRAKEGLPLDAVWSTYSNVIQRRDKQPGKDTLRIRHYVFNRFMRWVAASQPMEMIEDVSYDRALSYFDFLRKNKDLKDQTRKSQIDNLSAIWNTVAAVHEVKNPWKDIRPKVRDGARHIAFSHEQEAAILEAAKNSEDPVWYVPSLIARWTGMRLVDVCYLEWKDVDFTNRVIHAKPVKTRGYDISVTIPMVPVLTDALQQLARRGKYVLPRLAKDYPVGLRKFPFAKVLAAAGITDTAASFHSWRHTFRTRLAEAGIPDELAKRLGGWVQDKTAQRYDHADKTEDIRRALEATIRP